MTKTLRSSGALAILLLHFALDLVGNIENALRGSLADKTLGALCVMLQRTLLAEVVLALGDYGVGHLLPGLPAHVAGKWQPLILAILLIP